MSYPMRRDWSRSWPAPRWDPLAEFEAMRDRMNRLFGEVLGGTGLGRAGPPDVECDETADAWLVEARLPGFAPSDVTIELVERELSIMARREREEMPQPGGRMARRGDFSYHVTLPGEVDASGVEARMDNGVLSVRLPKSPAAKPHRIEVAAGRQLTGTAAQAGGEAGQVTGTAAAPMPPPPRRAEAGGQQKGQPTPPPPGAAPGPPPGQSGQRRSSGTTYQGGQPYGR